MLNPTHPLAKLLEEDRRYAFEAYVFVFEALSFAQDVLQLGTETPSEPLLSPSEQSVDDEDTPERHVTGQELCEAIRQYAVEQYGYMAKTVLNNWGINETGDFGSIVFNLIEIGQMRKTPNDRREDFDDVYDFDAAFHRDFKIEVPGK